MDGWIKTQYTSSDREENYQEFYLVVIVYCCLLQKYCTPHFGNTICFQSHGFINSFSGENIQQIHTHTQIKLHQIHTSIVR